MKKSQFYLSQCVEAASKSPMRYTLGSALVKGGKVISTGFNHQRPNYDAPGSCGTPASMHAEMACIFNATRGQGPVHKQQQHENQAQQQQQKGSYEKDPGGSPRGGLDARRAPTSIVPHAQQRSHHDEDQDQAESQLPAEDSADLRAGGGAGKKRERERERGNRSRNPKLQGADLYVCRVNKSGEFGCARPCWRCVEWCAWAGVRRIFHWSVAEGRFVCLKVGGASEEDCYQTVADFRFLTGRFQ